MHHIAHFKTVTRHKIEVMKGCFAVGLYAQGLMHDLSKYSPQEFLVGAKYYQGDRSPNNAEREEKGYSSSWLHHKGRNKHHFEYWIDYCGDLGKPDVDPLQPAPMPDKCIIEMFMDRIAASKIYNGEAYTDRDPLTYFERGKGNLSRLIHPDTSRKLWGLLRMLAQKGERVTFAYIRHKLKSGRGLP